MHSLSSQCEQNCVFISLFAPPLSQVIPALVARLPLEEDLEENKTVYSCLAMLYGHSPGLVRTPCSTYRALAYLQLSLSLSLSLTGARISNV